jgi:dihydrofolate reductase
MITMIACVGNNNVIGKDGKMPWHLPEDLKHFKRITLGQAVAMGRKTFESLPNKPLKDRDNYVISRRGINTMALPRTWNRTIKEILEIERKDKEVFIAGGAEIYNQFIQHAHKLIITRVVADFDGDTFFPTIGAEWIPVDMVKGTTNEENPYEYYFIEYERVSK